jgi:mRNA-degrading endonuclease RelE of RelBE toxin-antitoxin system
VRYTVVFRKSAQREFEALSQGQKKALFQKLKVLEENPTPSETVELVQYAPLRRIKAGDARAIYDAPDARNRIFILRVGSDHSIYDNLDEIVEE